MIESNLKIIINELKDSNIKLIAVSKNQSIEKIKKVYNHGIKDFGENKVQELLKKIDNLPNDIRWHMIGHLQTNKVKSIIDKVYLIHSVDSVKLATTIDKEAKKKNIIVNILLEINIANEESKYGFKIEELNQAIKKINMLNNVKIQGFMTVAPYTLNPEDNRIYFTKMKELLNKYNYKILSMGMSNDYKIAIEEGSTHIRIGTKIFGERDYTKKEV